MAAAASVAIPFTKEEEDDKPKEPYHRQATAHEFAIALLTSRNKHINSASKLLKP